jgi:hypothetical protein
MKGITTSLKICHLEGVAFNILTFILQRTGRQEYGYTKLTRNKPNDYIDIAYNSCSFIIIIIIIIIIIYSLY